MDGQDFENTWDMLKSRANTIKAQLEGKINEGNMLDNELKHMDVQMLEEKVPEVAECKREIEKGVKDLNNVVEQIQRSAVSAPQRSQSTRFKTISQELSKESVRVRKALDDHFARKQLFGKSQIADPNEVENGLLRERSMLDQTLNMTDDVIAQAAANAAAIKGQNKTFESWGGKLGGIQEMLPDIDTLVGKIGTKKRQESMVLGATIGVCVVFTIWYKFLA